MYIIIPLHESVTYIYIIYKTYFLLCLVLLSWVDFLSNKVRNLHINTAESYISFKYDKWDLLWYEKLILHLFHILSCLLKLAFAWLSQLRRYASFWWCHLHLAILVVPCLWIPYYSRHSYFLIPVLSVCQ